jgi:hypothetical protein
MTPAEYRREIIADLGRHTHDPYGFVMWAWPWGVKGGPLENETGPDDWQREQLQGIGEGLRENPFQLQRESTASGHGIGKTTEVAWIAHWALMTHEDTRGTITSNTDTQLRTKTWPELAKWHSMLRFPILREMFKVEATSFFATEAGHERNWRIDAIPWSERNTEAFAGLHNAGKRTILIFDEASAIIDPIWEVAEGALTDANTEMLWLAYGNPTRNSGRFKQTIAGRFRHLWRHRQIDSRTVRRTNKKLLQEWIDAYGDDSDFVRVRVKGMFPRAASTQFISSDLATAARTRPIPEGLVTDPIIFGVDCARFGDDASVLAVRKGRDARTIPWLKWHHQDSMRVAGDIAIHAQRWKPDAVFVDAGNIGAAVVDRLRQLGVKNVMEVWFGADGREAWWDGGLRVKTMNKRSEIWTSMRAWLSNGAIPDEDDLEADMTAVEYGYGPDQTSILLEKKKDTKARLLASPDNADALACTFAEPVAPRVPAHRDPASYLPDPPGAIVDRYAELR